MLHKFEFGAKLYMLFANFSTGCFLNVKVGNVKSEYTTVNSSEPQKTILGPLLIILSINIVSTGLSDLPIQLYADDT